MCPDFRGHFSGPITVQAQVPTTQFAQWGPSIICPTRVFFLATVAGEVSG